MWTNDFSDWEIRYTIASLFELAYGKGNKALNYFYSILKCYCILDNFDACLRSAALSARQKRNSQHASAMKVSYFAVLRFAICFITIIGLASLLYKLTNKHSGVWGRTKC